MDFLIESKIKVLNKFKNNEKRGIEYVLYIEA